MKVRVQELLAIMQASKNQICELVKKNTNLHEEMSWLYVPKRRKNNICLVAHIDTVWDDERKNLAYDSKNKVIYSKSKITGIGADDRAGVYSLLKIFCELSNEEKPYMLFTDYEEFGGLGAFEAVEKFGDILSDVNFFIELDRQGSREFVTYNGEEANKDFMDFVTSFGLHHARGSFSDIAITGEMLRIAGINVSSGFYFEHTPQEILYPKIVADSINKVMDIIRNSRNKAFRLPVVERNY